MKKLILLTFLSTGATAQNNIWYVNYIVRNDKSYSIAAFRDSLEASNFYSTIRSRALTVKGSIMRGDTLSIRTTDPTPITTR
jgi:hypothetical protein